MLYCPLFPDKSDACSAYRCRRSVASLSECLASFDDCSLFAAALYLYYNLISTIIQFHRYRITMPGRTAEPTDRFQALVKALSDKLGPCSGINSDDVDEKELQKLMEDYVSDESEWEKYSMAQPNTAYTRNLVDKGNGKSNLVPINSDSLL